MVNGVEPETAFEGYIKAQVETLNREMIDTKKMLIEMRDSWIFSKGKLAGYSAVFGICGGAAAVLIRAFFWR